MCEERQEHSVSPGSEKKSNDDREVFGKGWGIWGGKGLDKDRQTYLCMNVYVRVHEVNSSYVAISVPIPIPSPVFARRLIITGAHPARRGFPARACHHI